MSDTPTPPESAEIVLRLAVPREHRDSVSGDLLEEYRESVCVARGHSRANLWYVQQVAQIVWHGTWQWGVLHGLLFALRTADDWLVPPTDFTARSTLSTATGVAIFLGAGFAAGRRLHAVESGALAGFATAVIGAITSAVATTMLLAAFHDPATLSAIRASGGLEEVYALPLMLVVPGTVLGTLGAAIGVLTSRLVPRSS